MRRFLPAFIGVLSFVVFIPALSGEFLTWDDDINLVSNTFYRGLGSSQIRWAFSNVRMGHYIPLTWLGLSANYAAGGMNPWGYHLVNVILHVANAVTFYFVARRLLAAAGDGGRQDRRADPALGWGAAFAALVFALHPLRVESVAWITERRDVQSGFFYLLSILTHLRSLEAGERAQWRWRAGSLLLFAAGLLSKASIMVLPAVLVLLDVYPLRRGALSWRRLVVEKAGYWVLGAAGAGGALIALRLSGLQITSYGAYGPEARAAMMAYSFWFYPSTWVWPVRLSPMYELPARVDPLAEPFLGAIVGLVVVTAMLVLFRKRWPAGLAAWLYSALLILPISGAVHAGFQLAHDRYSYLSGLGFALVAGGAIAWALTAAGARRVGRPVLAAGLGVATLVVVALAVQSWQQLRIWRDSDTLWRWSLEADPRCAVCANNLAAPDHQRPRAESPRSSPRRRVWPDGRSRRDPRTTVRTIRSALCSPSGARTEPPRPSSARRYSSRPIGSRPSPISARCTRGPAGPRRPCRCFAGHGPRSPTIRDCGPVSDSPSATRGSRRRGPATCPRPSACCRRPSRRSPMTRTFIATSGSPSGSTARAPPQSPTWSAR